MNYYQHHIGDFIRDTARLSDPQCMAYMRLIWLYYETESPIENDIDAIAFKIGANASDLQQILKHFFFLHDDGLWHQARCDKEILAFREKSDKAKKSADARWNNANAMRAHSERNADEPLSDANQEPITSNQEPKDQNTFVNGKPPTCPHQEIISLYNEILPELQAVIPERWSGTREKHLQARWRESPKHQSIEFWKRFFTTLRNYSWYLGQNDRGWRASLGWIVEKKNFDNLIEKFVTDSRRSGAA